MSPGCVQRWGMQGQAAWSSAFEVGRGNGTAKREKMTRGGKICQTGNSSAEHAGHCHSSFVLILGCIIKIILCTSGTGNISGQWTHKGRGRGHLQTRRQTLLREVLVHLFYEYVHKLFHIFFDIEDFVSEVYILVIIN